MDKREARRTSYPLTIPDALLHSDAMQRACAERNFQEIFRLVNRRTGSSHATIAGAIGKMTSTRVSDIIRGVRGIRGQQVIERVADGFGIPGDMLGVPSRPWEGSPTEGASSEVPTYTDSDQELPGSAVHSAQETAAPPLTDTLLVSLLIEGRRQVVPVNRRELITAITGAALSSRDVTAFPTPTGSRQSVAHPSSNVPHAEVAIDHLKEMWHSLVRADNLFGPRHALSSVRQQLFILESLLDCTRGAQRLELLRLSAQYAESAAWLYEDSADISNASTWTSQAMEWAAESGDQTMIAWTLFRRSQQATTKKNAAQAISLAQAAQRNEQVLTAPMRASAMQQEAHGYALDGDERACHNLLDEAHKFAASPTTKGDARSGHGDFCTPSYIEIQRANCWLSLRRPDLAVPLFERALSELPDSYQRDRGFTQARLAMAYAGIQKYDESAAQAASALAVASSSGSIRTMNEAVKAVNTLGETHASSVVSTLFETIKEEPEL